MTYKGHNAYRLMIAILLLVLGFWLVSFVAAATFTVTTTADSGPGSLRQAITDANASPGLDTITFAIGATGSQQTIQPSALLPSITSPVFLDGWSQGGVGYNGPPLIELNGVLAGSYGLRITSGSSTVRGLAINGFVSGVILLTADGNWIYGCHIGTDLAGETAVSNITGISISTNSNSNIIGVNGDGVGDAAEGNLISGNSDWGILFAQIATMHNVVAGNKIGTDITGMASIPNGTVGSPRAGIYLGGYDNLIGSNFDGVSDDLERNLISGNANNSTSGILLQYVDQPGALPNAIAGNWIGVDATGLAGLPNNYGMSSASGTNTGLIVQRNVISANTYDGIGVNMNQATVTGNLIGVAADGVTPLGNGQNGITLTGSDNQIGGTDSGEANIIAHNGTVSAFYSGVLVGNTALRNTIRGNHIFANSRLGIDLRWPDGVNINDDDDPDTGGNNLQNYPVITFAQSYSDGTTVIQGTLNSNPNTQFTLDFYFSAAADPSGYGEGEFYLGETSVTTDASGDATFDVTLPATIPPDQFVSATATHADGSTSEFSLAYAAGGVLDVSIAGLAAQVTPPIYVDLPAQFTASVNAGTGVSYAWDFGDGQLGSGAVAAHTFTTPGVYTVTLSATNNSSNVDTTTAVTALEPANINGVVWQDRDADGFFGLGEIAYPTSPYVIITATLQGPPNTVLNAPLQNGSYQIFTPQAGVYLVEVTNTVTCPLITNCISTPNPAPVAVGADGGTEVNFGVLPVAFSPQPNDAGYIYGRAWQDINANGYPDLDEIHLNNQTIRLLDAAGNLVATTTTGTSWGYGSYAFRITAPGVYRVQMDAPSGSYPASREVEVTVADKRVVSAQLPFARGGHIGGQITDSGGTAVTGVAANLLPGNLSPNFYPGGGYGFFGLDTGNYTLQLTPPANYVTADGVTQRFVPAALNGSAVENWTLLKKGELTIKAVQVVNGQPLPINFMFFEVLLNGSQVQLVTTNAQGEALVQGLAPGTYTVRPWGELANIIPGLSFSPAERTAVVSNNSAATLSFTGTLSRSLNLTCQLAGSGGQGFACNYEVRTLNGSLLDFGHLPANQPATSNWNLNPATLEVRLIPDPDVPGQEGWPTHSQIVVIADNTHANVYYPFNPANPQTIAGYAYWDRCAPQGMRANSNYCTESNVPSNNGVPVTLYNASGAVITSTLTTQGTNWNTGYFSFPNLPIGTYRARVNLPTGYAPTSGVEKWFNLNGVGAPDLLEVGYQLNENQVLGGKVFWDTDGNGVFDEAWDDPLAGAAIAITRPDGTPVVDLTTGSNGGYAQSPINSGDYRVTLTHAGQAWMRAAAVPLNGGVPLIDFPLAPAGSQLRVLLFVDGDHDGEVGATEQRLAGVSVQLFSGSCGGLLDLALQTAVTDAGGLAIFAEPSAGNQTLCARVSAGLPSGVVVASPLGVTVKRNATAPVALAAQPTGTLRVRPFWDADGDAQRDSDEPYIVGGSATVNGVTLAIPAGGASFSLPSGSYNVSLTLPAGYSPGGTLPLSVPFNATAAQTVAIPLRDGGSVSGKIFTPDTFQTFTIGGGSLAAGLTVELLSQSSGQVIATASSAANGGFSFANLTPGAYRLRLPNPPPGFVADAEPLLTYQSGLILSGQNLSLVPTGHVSGLVYQDSNGNGQRDGSVSGTSQFAVRLVGFGGQEIATALPNAYGYFLFDGLNANEPYAVQVVLTESDWYVSASPGIFTVGLQPKLLEIGLNNSVPSGESSGYFYAGQVVVQQGATRMPVAGARLINFAPPCTATNPVIVDEQVTGLGGGYIWWDAAACSRVVDVPGYAPKSFMNLNDGTVPCADCVLVQGYYLRLGVDIVLAQAVAQVAAQVAAQSQATQLAVADQPVAWLAFRDDNGNALRDEGEPGLPGVTVSANGSSVVSGMDGAGMIMLPDGQHMVTITPPPGYVVHGPAARPLAIQGAAVALPPIALRPLGLTTVQAFMDLDGDGAQDGGEAGVGGVTITLTGAANRQATTTGNGRSHLTNLPDGNYTVSAVLPAGYAPLSPVDVTLSQGGVINLPLHVAGLVSGVLYDDWDGDGQQQDELIFRTPFTLTLANGTTTQPAATLGGRGYFLNTSGGGYTLAATDEAVAAHNLTLLSGQGYGAGLAVVASGVVRGTAWLDGNADGLRQPWESPLAGVPVTLNGQTVVTDENGRFAFTSIASGSYGITAVLPTGLTAEMGEVVVSEGRGAVVGVAARTGFAVYLPLVIRE